MVASWAGRWAVRSAYLMVERSVHMSADLRAVLKDGVPLLDVLLADQKVDQSAAVWAGGMVGCLAAKSAGPKVDSMAGPKVVPMAGL